MNRRISIVMPRLNALSPTAADNLSLAIINFAMMRMEGDALPSIQAVDRKPRYIVGCNCAVAGPDNAAVRARTTLAAALLLRWRLRPTEVLFLADTFMAADAAEVLPSDNPEAVECLWMVYARWPGDAWCLWLPYGWEDDGTLTFRESSQWVPIKRTVEEGGSTLFVTGSLGEAVRLAVAPMPRGLEVPEPPDDEALEAMGVYDIGEAEA